VQSLTAGEAGPQARLPTAKGQVDPTKLLIGAFSWGGNPGKGATYLRFEPAKNDGDTVYDLVVKSAFGR
jgi:hypothetical protein